MSGRLGRWGYCWRMLLSVGVYVSILRALPAGVSVGVHTVGMPLLLVLNSVLVVRRLHDLDRPGSDWLRLTMNPKTALLFPFMIMAQRGTVGDNRFGPDPVHSAAGSTPPAG